MLKNQQVFLLGLLILISNTLASGQEEGSVTVYLKNSPNQMIYLYELSEDRNLLDSAQITEGDTIIKFAWKVPYTAHSLLEILFSKKGSQLLVPILYNDHVKFYIDIAKTSTLMMMKENVIIEGSETASVKIKNELIRLKNAKQCRKLKEMGDSLLKIDAKEYKWHIDSIKQKIIEIRKEDFRLQISFTLDTETPAIAYHEFLGLLVLQDVVPELNMDKEIYQVYEQLKIKFPNAIDLQKYLDKYAERRKIPKIPKLQIGDKVENIQLSDIENKLIRLVDISKKYVLIDFWASWCKPCREEVPYLQKAFDKYKNKFTIYSISIDTDEIKWKEAIEKDKSNAWIQTLDNKNEIARKFQIETIPTNFLIDKKGKIIAINLRGEALIEKLEELLK